MSSLTIQEMRSALLEAARIASIMVDGDKARRIVTPRALHYLASPDPEYRYLAADFYDVDHARFLDMKKTLLRLERLVSFPCSTALWLQVEELDSQLTLLVQNGNIHRYYAFGIQSVAAENELAACIESREVTLGSEPHPTRTITALAPVFDSLGNVVGVVELSAMDPTANARPPAWN